jgi:hypothetical protein
MPETDPTSTDLLQRSVQSGRVHSAYLVTGVAPQPAERALEFARALVCEAAQDQPCNACPTCQRSQPKELIPLDGDGKKGPFFRHIGDHPDLYWVERGANATRIKIGQIRAIQKPLHLHANEGGYRVAIIDQAQHLNAASQNALLHLLEEPPPKTTLVLVADASTSLLATIRSRCQRVALPPPPLLALTDDETPEEIQELAQRLNGMGEISIPHLMDWAEEYRGARAVAAAEVEVLLDTSSRWLRERVEDRLHQEQRAVTSELEIFSTLAACRKALIQRNANPQMIAERALFALRGAVIQ